MLTLKKSETFDNEWVLFISFDLCNSTAYKNEVSPEEWFNGLLAFYGLVLLSMIGIESKRIEIKNKLIEDKYKEILNDFRKKKIANGIKKHEFKLWKLLGDEVLVYHFYKNLNELYSKIEELFPLLKNIVHELNTWVKEKIAPSLGVKATAWLGDFRKESNKNIAFDLIGDTGSDDNHNQKIDFVGQSMDTGFRISKYVSENRLAIGAELAWVLIKKARKKNLFLVGMEKLKGVWKNKPYPIFWFEESQNYFKKSFTVVERVYKNQEEYFEFYQKFKDEDLESLLNTLFKENEISLPCFKLAKSIKLN